MKKLTVLFLCLILILTTIISPLSITAAGFEPEYGIDNLNEKSGNVKVAFLGGSITYGGSANPRLTNRYSTLLIEKFFKQKFPNKTFEEINAGIGGTPSEYGVFRTYEHIAKHNPDVVFVEYAVNDEGYVLTETGKRNVRSNMEGIVRQLLALPKIPTIIFLYTHDTYPNGSTPLSGDLDVSITEHQKIADYYGIGTVNLHEYIETEEAKGTFVWYDRTNPASTTALTNDAVHPNNNGHKVYADYITNKFNENYSAYFKKPLTGKPHYERGYIFQNPEIVHYDNEYTTYTGSWVKSHEAGFAYNSTAYPSTAWDGWILSKVPGDTATFNFTGRSIGISYGYSMIKGGKMKCTVDKGTQNEITWEVTLTPTSSESYSTTYNLISRDLPYGEHTLTVENVSTDATNCYIGFAHFLTDAGEPQSIQPVLGANDDYVPNGNRPANLIAKPSSSALYTSSNSNAVGRATGDVAGYSTKYIFNGIDGVAKFYYGTNFQIEGTYAASIGTANFNLAGFNGYLPTGPTSYVMEFLASNTSPEGVTPVMSAGIMTSGGTTAKGMFSQEVTSRDKWQKVKGVVNLNCQNPTNMIFQVGYGTNSIPELGTSFQIYNYATYVAEEVAFDISHESTNGKNTVSKGGAIATESKILNQIGLTGTLPQNFTYKVLTADRTAEVPGITVTAEHGGRATIEVDNTVAYGDYVILATSEDYPAFKKGFTITVADTPNYDDYIPGEKPANIIANNSNVNTFTGRWLATFETIAPSQENGIVGAVSYPITASPKYWGDSSAFAVVGGDMTAGIKDYKFKANTNYVISTELMNHPDSAVNGKFGYMIRTKDDNGNACQPAQIVEVTSNTEWQNFKFVLHVDYDGTATNALHFGYPNHSSMHNPQGTNILHRLGSLYIAEEVIYDITNKVNENTNMVKKGDSIELEASVVNQIGTEGSLMQNFTWSALNEDRSEVASGITITEGEEGNATVTIGNNVPAGKYVILAESDDYAGMRKGAVIEVLDFEGISELNIDTSLYGKAYLNASVKTASKEEILFIIASYSGNRLIKSNRAIVPVLNGEASVKSLGIDVAPGENVRAFAWTSNLSPIPNPNGYNTNVTVLSEDELYGDELPASLYDMPEVADYLDNKKGAVSITFDDGMYDAAVFYDNLFEKNDIKGTAMIVSDWLSETSIPKWQELVAKGNIEVGNHSKAHAIQYKTDNPTAEELEEDITGGYNALKAMFPNEKIITFAPPWTQSTTASIAEISKNHYASRTSGNGFLSANPSENDYMHIPALILFNTNTADELNAHVDTAIANKSWFTVLMHGVGDGTYNVKEDVCTDFFNYIGSRKDDVWAGALGEIVQYMYEKQNYTINVNWIKENAMSLTLTDTLDNTTFDFPLTFKVNVPDDWNKVSVHQNGAVKQASVFTENGKKYAYVNIVPDKGEIILSK